MATRWCSGARTRCKRRVSHAQLHAGASRVAAALTAHGIAAGDRVAAFMPNMPETIVALLGRHGARRDLVVVLARLRRAGRARPLRPDRAARPLHRRRLLVQRQADLDPRQGGGDRGAPAVGRARRRRALPAAEPGRVGRPVGSARRAAVGRLARAGARRPDRLRGPAVRPPAVHPVLLRHHRRAEVHRPRCGRHAAAAPEGASAAWRREARRPAVLLHHLRLDDVELAGVGAGRRARRCCCTTARPSSTAAASSGNSRTRSA